MRGIFSVAVFGAVAFTAAYAALPKPAGYEFDCGAKFTVSGYAAGKPALSGYRGMPRESARRSLAPAARAHGGRAAGLRC